MMYWAGSLQNFSPLSGEWISCLQALTVCSSRGLPDREPSSCFTRKRKYFSLQQEAVSNYEFCNVLSLQATNLSDEVVNGVASLHCGFTLLHIR